MADAKWQQGTVAPFLEKVFDQYHGKDAEALEQLKQLAAQSPFPQAGFTVQSMAEVAAEKREKFEESNPQLALWMRIKAALADANGEEYFVSSLQNAQVPQLRGLLVEARPACRPKELLVAVPPSGAAEAPEIALKLDKPLAGKPEFNAEFQWEGVPAAFTRTPFLLTMDTETAKIDGLRTTPCAPPPGRRTVPKKKQ